MISKILSLAIAAAYLVAVYLSGDREALLWLVIDLVFVLALIWFGDDMAHFAVGSGLGGHGIGRVDESSPPFFIKLMGWILLLLPLLIIPLVYLITAR